MNWISIFDIQFSIYFLLVFNNCFQFQFNPQINEASTRLCVCDRFDISRTYLFFGIHIQNFYTNPFCKPQFHVQAYLLNESYNWIIPFLCSVDSIWITQLLSIYFKKVEWVAKVKQNFERGGNVKFSQFPLLTLENIERQCESRILIHTICPAQSHLQSIISTPHNVLLGQRSTPNII